MTSEDFKKQLDNPKNIYLRMKIIEDLIKRAEISLPEKNLVSNASPGKKLVK